MFQTFEESKKFFHNYGVSNWKRKREGRRYKYVHNRFFDYPVSHLSELEQFIFLAVVEKKAALGFSN